MGKQREPMNSWRFWGELRGGPAWKPDLLFPNTDLFPRHQAAQTRSDSDIPDIESFFFLKEAKLSHLLKTEGGRSVLAPPTN